MILMPFIYLRGWKITPYTGYQYRRQSIKSTFCRNNTNEDCTGQKKKNYDQIHVQRYLSLDLRGLLLDAYTNEVIVGPVFMMFTCVIHNVVANRK